MALWGVEIKPGKPFTLLPNGGRLKISQATLGLGSFNNMRSCVQCNVGRKIPVLLCSLLPDKVESIGLDLEFQETEEVTFSVIGPRSVHLTGYFVGEAREQLARDDESESFGEDIGDADTEVSDDLEEYEGSFIDDGESSYFSPSPSSSEEAIKEKKKSGKRKRLRKKYALSESEDDGVTLSKNASCDRNRKQIVESDQDDQKPISSLRGNAKMDSDAMKRKIKEDRVDDVDGSTPNDKQNGNKKVKTKSRKNEKSEPTKKLEKPSNLEKTVGESVVGNGGTQMKLGTRTLSDGLVIEELDLGEENAKVATSGKKVTVHYTGRLQEGDKVFDSSVGKKPLKFRLSKHSCNEGTIDGLNLGIEGMRIGGRRRLIIPPKLGYDSEGTDGVPPNSWLIMDVELLRVR